MAVPPDRFDRVAERVDVGLLSGQHVAIVGVGTVGSQIARELANSGVGQLTLIDGDVLETHNLARHALTQQSVGANKAIAMGDALRTAIPSLQVNDFGVNIADDLPEAHLDTLLDDADLIVAATDDRGAQRRLGRRALALDIPAIFPALYGDAGGEVFVQLAPGLPCFLCWDGFRPSEEQLRAVSALNADALAVIQLAVYLSLGLLDPRSEFANLLVSDSDAVTAPLQVFVQQPLAALEMVPATPRPGCTACTVGPSPLRAESAAAGAPWRRAPVATEAPPPASAKGAKPSRRLRRWGFAAVLVGAVCVAAYLGLQRWGPPCWGGEQACTTAAAADGPLGASQTLWLRDQTTHEYRAFNLRIRGPTVSQDSSGQPVYSDGSSARTRLAVCVAGAGDPETQEFMRHNGYFFVIGEHPEPWNVHLSFPMSGPVAVQTDQRAGRQPLDVDSRGQEACVDARRPQQPRELLISLLAMTDRGTGLGSIDVQLSPAR